MSLLWDARHKWVNNKMYDYLGFCVCGCFLFCFFQVCKAFLKSLIFGRGWERRGEGLVWCVMDCNKFMIKVCAHAGFELKEGHGAV